VDSPDGLAAPPPLDGPVTYPPMRWWPLRVMNPGQKFAVLVVMTALNAVIIWMVSPVLTGALGVILLHLVSTALLIAVARSFRGPGEPIAPPRAWWRLTARPLAGWWLSGVYLLGVVQLVIEPPRTFDDGATAVFPVLVGLAFLNSSIRLTMLRRHPQI